jgi:hypothetical protein
LSMARRKWRSPSPAAQKNSAADDDLTRPLLRAALEQGICFGGCGALTIAVLRELDPANPKARHGPSGWPPGALTSLALAVGMLAAVVLFNVCVGALQRGRATATAVTAVASAAEATALPRLTLSERGAGRVAWPTVLLALASVGLHGTAAFLGASGWLPSGWAVLLCTAAIFCSFTPMHDAVHGSVFPGRGQRWLNDAVGLLASAYVCSRAFLSSPSTKVVGGACAVPQGGLPDLCGAVRSRGALMAARAGRSSSAFACSSSCTSPTIATATATAHKIQMRGRGRAHR